MKRLVCYKFQNAIQGLYKTKQFYQMDSDFVVLLPALGNIFFIGIRNLFFLSTTEFERIQKKGTGGIADFIADKRTNGTTKEMESSAKTLLDKNKAAQDSNDNQVKGSDEYVPEKDEIVEYMEQLFKYRELVVVFDPTGTNGNLEDAIADAMLKSIEFRRKEEDSSNNSLIQIEMELKWCLMWNKFDHARQNVFANHVFENMTPLQTKQAFIARVASATLYEAFSRNHVQFVKLLMENGVSIKDLKIEQLEPEQLKMFCARILGIIDQCFAEDRRLAIGIIENNAVAFYNYKPLKIAKRADCKAFLASDTIDEYLSHRWYDEFDRRYQPLNIHISVWVFLASVFLPLLPIVAVLWPPIYKKSSTKSKETNKLVQYPMILPNELISTPEKTPDKLCSKLSEVGKRIKDFYDAPVVKFYYHFIFFFSFLVLFSYVLLVDYLPLNLYGDKRSGIRNLPISISEIVLHIYMLSFIIDELYQFIKSKIRPHGYFLNSWNWMDLAGIICYISAFITRFIVGENVFAASKILMSIDFIIWCIRILYFCTVFELLGPKLVMIYKMMRDTFLIFVCFILVFLFAFSIASWSLLNTNNQITWLYTVNGSFIDATVSSEDGKWWNWHLLRDLLNWGIWKVFGQVAEPYKNNATDMDAVSENDVYGTFVFLFATVFVVLSNVLLLNILIAMFNVDWILYSQTTGDVIKKSKRFGGISGSEKSKNNYYQMNLEKVYAEKYWKSNVFNRDVKTKTDLALERLETKLNKDKVSLVENVQQVKVRYSFCLIAN
ncbi:unnamed protein product [Rotaria magnacalcarata]|uniref:Ion transport domain-containing protein n=2 Tax=Rotaria magnacalcarata TaxID=392030 RepID=A0A819SAX7_9BILA|nr:unnamed protein product [Rotaria magnacalcarata]